MSPVKESAEVALSFLDSMKKEPMALALCVLSFALIGLLYFQSAQFTTQRRENVALFIKVQSDVQNLLAKCVIPAPENRQRGEVDAPQHSDLGHLVKP